MKGRYGTTFVETEVLLAVRGDDMEHARNLLDDFLPGELHALGEACDSILRLIRLALLAKASGVSSRWLDADGDEWWEIEGEGFRLTVRSGVGSMSGRTRAEVEQGFGPLTRIERGDGRD